MFLPKIHVARHNVQSCSSFGCNFNNPERTIQSSPVDHAITCLRRFASAVKVHGHNVLRGVQNDILPKPSSLFQTLHHKASSLLTLMVDSIFECSKSCVLCLSLSSGQPQLFRLNFRIQTNLSHSKGEEIVFPSFSEADLSWYPGHAHPHSTVTRSGNGQGFTMHRVLIDLSRPISGTNHNYERFWR